MLNLTPSQEDYLEAIYNQVIENGCAKVTDISNILNVKKASVTGALNNLVNKKLINYAPYSAITLTPLGEKYAKEISNKHQVMAKFFSDILNLPEDEAVENACKMEHIMSEELFDRIIKFSAFIEEFSSINKNFKDKIKNLYD